MGMPQDAVNLIREWLSSRSFYYNASIWLTPGNSSDVKQNLLLISANALRSCLRHEGNAMLSFELLHKTHQKSTPKQIMLYQIAIGLHKKVNSCHFPNTFEQVSFLDQVICTGRQLKFQIHRNFNGEIGLNKAANKFYYINDEISLDMLSLSFCSL